MFEPIPSVIGSLAGDPASLLQAAVRNPRAFIAHCLYVMEGCASE
ncbi:MAG: hypothetical protein OXK72_09385 [Gammaproteobacteria bacterium]|nr:hypothetical protein [Gammaproteobacteria bacterium]